MSDIAISCERLGKRYRIGQPESYGALRDTLTNALSAPFRHLRARSNGTNGHGNPPADESFWALKDVSFDVHQGEVVGIIGRNGAGKSTLLKILSRITKPTEGHAKINGRVGSLLEVGTGFHPELTGRENIFLNGAILGMKKAEIERKFDEIVAFAELEKFIDTPVKRYSSGMYVRLAFAVAAHLEPNILIVDEVLAVGDVAFQKKCLGKMNNVASQGRTVLFVSHNMAAISRLCERAILLDAGEVLSDGPSHQVVNVYLNSGVKSVAVREWPDISKAPGDDVARLCAVRVRNADNKVADVINIREAVSIEVEYEVFKSGVELVANVSFTNEEGILICIVHDWYSSWRGIPRPVGRYRSTVSVPGNFLSEGALLIGVAVSSYNPVSVHCHESDAVTFQVVDGLEGETARGHYGGNIPGVIRPMWKWNTIAI